MKKVYSLDSRLRGNDMGPWLILDSGVRRGEDNMAIDRKALEGMIAGAQRLPLIRFFQWDKPTISYGHLLDPAAVKLWSQSNGGLPYVRRPTGGGAVRHDVIDLSVSILWPRNSDFFSSNPRHAYAEIHAVLKEGVRDYLGNGTPLIFMKPASACEPPPQNGTNGNGHRLSLCFQEPVCNDVMLGDRKIIGGALRFTKKAVLYQGTVQLKRTLNVEKLKNCLLSAFTSHAAPAQ